MSPIQGAHCGSWIFCMSRTPNTVVLSRCGLTNMFTMLCQRKLSWLVRRMDNGIIHKYFLYGELTAGKRNLGRPQLRYLDVCRRDMKELSIDKNKWEELVTDRSN